MTKKRKKKQAEAVGRDPEDRNVALSLPLLLLALLLVGLANTGPIATNDYGLHLRIGEEIAHSGLPPGTDSHSHTFPGAPYPDHEWLSQFGMYAVHQIVGDGGMVVLKGLLVALALAALAAAVSGGTTTRIGLILMVMLLGLHHSQMRPHLLSWLMAGLLVLLLERRMRWAVPLLLLVWANCHGSVLLAVGIAGLHFLEEAWHTRSRKPLVWAAACAVTPLLNPAGFGIYTIFFEISGHTGFIGEWKPYTPETAAFWLLVAVIGAAAIGLLKNRTFSPFDALRLAVLAFFAFQSSRNGVVAAIYLAPMITRWIGPAVERRPRRTRGLLAGLLLGVLLLTLGLRAADGRALRFTVDHQQLPLAAISFLQKHRLDGPVYNDYNFGGTLLWKDWPRLPVFIDGRTEVYRGKVLNEYRTVSRARGGWERIIEGYGVRFFFVRPERAIARVLLEHPGWELVYFDYHSAIYVQQGLYPALRRLRVVSPYGHRDRTRVNEAVDEMRYLLAENPLFFGGHKILAFLLQRKGDPKGASEALRAYLELHPQGSEVEDTRSLIADLKREGAWP